MKGTLSTAEGIRSTGAVAGAVAWAGAPAELEVVEEEAEEGFREARPDVDPDADPDPELELLELEPELAHLAEMLRRDQLPGPTVYRSSPVLRERWRIRFDRRLAEAIAVLETIRSG